MRKKANGRAGDGASPLPTLPLEKRESPRLTQDSAVSGSVSEDGDGEEEEDAATTRRLMEEFTCGRPVNPTRGLGQQIRFCCRVAAVAAAAAAAVGTTTKAIV